MSHDDITEITGYEEYLRSEFKKDYKAYLASETWRLIRSQAIANENGYCRDCGALATEVHHINYPVQFGEEDLEDLVAVCRTCHQLRHKDLVQQISEKRLEQYKNELSEYPEEILGLRGLLEDLDN